MSQRAQLERDLAEIASPSFTIDDVARRRARRQRRRRAGAIVVSLCMATAATVGVVRGFAGPGPRPGPAETPAAESFAAPVETRFGSQVELNGKVSGITAGYGSVWAARIYDASVVRIDAQSGQVIGVVDVGRLPSGIAAGAGAIWVANETDGILAAIDPATLVVRQVPTGLRMICGSPVVSDGLVWVAGAPGPDHLGNVRGLDPATGEVRVESSAKACTLAAAGGSIWGASGHVLTRIDASSGAVLHTASMPDAVMVELGPAPAGDGALWVSDEARETLYRVDLTTGRIDARFAVGYAPRGVRADADGVWLVNLYDGTLRRVDPATGRTTAVVRVGEHAVDLALAGGRLWVSGGDDHAVYGVDLDRIGR